ncbi:hypothetical protein HN51_052466 [Arachis hypogaea]
MALVSPSLLHYILKSFFDFHIVCAELVLTGFVDRWLSPPLGAVKLNVDGCLFGDDITLVEIAAKSGLSYPDSMASVVLCMRWIFGRLFPCASVTGQMGPYA